MAIDPNSTPKDYSLIIYSKTEIDAMEALETTRVDTELNSKSDKQDQGSPSGIATLDPAGKVNLVELPIATPLEALDPLDNVTLMTPMRVDYVLEAGE